MNMHFVQEIFNIFIPGKGRVDHGRNSVRSPWKDFDLAQLETFVRAEIALVVLVERGDFSVQIVTKTAHLAKSKVLGEIRAVDEVLRK